MGLVTSSNAEIIWAATNVVYESNSTVQVPLRYYVSSLKIKSTLLTRNAISHWNEYSNCQLNLFIMTIALAHCVHLNEWLTLGEYGNFTTATSTTRMITKSSWFRSQNILVESIENYEIIHRICKWYILIEIMHL